jgi:thioredoxin 1
VDFITHAVVRQSALNLAENISTRDKINYQEVLMTELKYVNTQDFKSEVLDDSLPVLVDFTATWCPPCKMVDPIVKELAAEWEGKVKVVKCDADQNPDILVTYSILGLPTVMLFKGGQMLERVTGYQPKDKLIGRMSPHFQL